MISFHISLDELRKLDSDTTKTFVNKKGETCLCLKMIPTPNSKYNDYWIVTETTKDSQGNYPDGTGLGNGKDVKKGDYSPKTSSKGTIFDVNL